MAIARGRVGKLPRRGFIAALALAGLAEIVYLAESDWLSERAPRLAKFVPILLKPSQVLDLRFWKINLPAGNQQIMQPELGRYQGAAFKVIEAVQFTAQCGGQAQPGSKYPRSELREMNPDGSNASWSPSSGTHVMDLTQRITHLPVVKPQVVCAQIHNETDYLILVEVESHNLYVRYRDSVVGMLDDRYQLGTFFDLRLEASRGHADVFYNGAHKIHYPLDAPGCYFKAGCYVQSNTSTGDLPTAYGQVEISRLEVSHS